jgi:hypothetical protein
MTSVEGDAEVTPIQASPEPTDVDADWPTDLYGGVLADEELGRRTLRLFLESEKWIHRRVESVSFSDDQTVVRRVSVDFTVPRSAPEMALPRGRSARLLPIAIIRKANLVSFDLRDSNGRALPLPVLRQNQKLTFAMLKGCARVMLSSDLDEEVKSKLEKISSGKKHETAQVISEVNKFNPVGGACCGQWHRLLHDVAFCALLRRLAYSFILFVAVEEKAGARVLLKYEYKRPHLGRYKEKSQCFSVVDPRSTKVYRSGDWLGISSIHYADASRAAAL